MMMEDMVTFENCCSSQAITDRNLKLGRAAERASKRWKSELFLSISEFNSHFQWGENRKICKIWTWIKTWERRKLKICFPLKLRVLWNFRNHFTFWSALAASSLISILAQASHPFIFNFVHTFSMVKLRPQLWKTVSVIWHVSGDNLAFTSYALARHYSAIACSCFNV